MTLLIAVVLAYAGLLVFVWSLGRIAAQSDNRKEKSDDSE